MVRTKSPLDNQLPTMVQVFVQLPDRMLDREEVVQGCDNTSFGMVWVGKANAPVTIELLIQWPLLVASLIW